MKRQSVFLGIALMAATLFIVSDANAQYRRYPGRYYGGGPRVSIGIGSIFGFGRWGGYYGGPSVGVSVMLPPIVIGGRVNGLPPGARRVYYGGVPYYYRNDTYYQENERGGYEVVRPPLGASISRLPMSARRRIINGQTFYEYNGTYFMEDSDNRGERRYIIVGANGRLDTDEALRQRDTYREDDNYDDDYNRRDDRDYNRDGSYENRRSNRNDGDVVVRNANEDYARENARANNNTNRSNNDEVYSAGPQVGDRFENLPRNSKTIKVGNETQYESPAGTRYKEVNEGGKTIYEVVKTR